MNVDNQFLFPLSEITSHFRLIISEMAHLKSDLRLRFADGILNFPSDYCSVCWVQQVYASYLPWRRLPSHLGPAYCDLVRGAIFTFDPHHNSLLENCQSFVCGYSTWFCTLSDNLGVLSS